MASVAEDGASSEGGWCTIESDPGVFTAMINDLGVQGVQVDELVDLSEEAFVAANLAGPIFGLLFLFKYDEVLAAPTTTPLTAGERPLGLIFSRQVIRNACATQAILAVLLNARQRGLELGRLLTEYAEFAEALDPETRGELLANSREICAIHNAFTPQRGILLEEDPALRDLLPSEDAFHYVAYVPFAGQVYELDGLQSGPSALGAFSTSPSSSSSSNGTLGSEASSKRPGNDAEIDLDWIRIALDSIRRRIARVTSQELRFSVLVVHRDPRDELRKLAASGDSLAASRLAEEESKHFQWQRENMLRRMDLMPLGIRLLVMLADQGRFQGMLEEVQRTRRQELLDRRKNP
jgi:ubiquitin carboxyl-terminal hydrolase L5